MTTSHLSDPTWVGRQYGDASKLDARIQLHALYSTNTCPWQSWVFDQLALAPGSRILELGAGKGDLWRDSRRHLSAGWQIVLTDLFPRMILSATQRLANSCRWFSFAVADAHSIPFADRQFDAVIANHMLYHVPDRAQALGEIHRTLRPGGQLFAATNGEAHMRQLEDLVQRFEPDLGYRLGELGFTLENGAQQLSPWFSNIELRLHADSLCVTEVEPLVDYVFSTVEADDETQRAFAGFVSIELESQGGAIHIGKNSGMLIARRKGEACGA